jgi:hypothetical protein
MVHDLGSPALVDGSVAFEAWAGIAQAMADASGYRVTFDAAVMEEDKDDPQCRRITAYRNCAAFEPTLFWKSA